MRAYMARLYYACQASYKISTNMTWHNTLSSEAKPKSAQPLDLRPPCELNTPPFGLRSAELGEPERVPQLVEQVDVAVAQGRNELRILGASGLIAASGDALQPGDQGIELAVAKLVDPPERGDDALARLALGVAMSFNEL